MGDLFVFGAGELSCLTEGDFCGDWAWARRGRIDNYDGLAWTLAAPDRGYLIFDRTFALEVEDDREAW